MIDDVSLDQLMTIKGEDIGELWLDYQVSYLTSAMCLMHLGSDI